MGAGSPEAWLDDLAAAPAGLRARVFEAAVRAAALDGVLHREEDARLQQLERVRGVPYDFP